MRVYTPFFLLSLLLIGSATPSRANEYRAVSRLQADTEQSAQNVCSPAVTPDDNRGSGRCEQ
ncbi:MAG: hypothetical protein KME26_11785 [Oscillatoria princeps RMCB-10]|nr:hypothetical protein [Oscillatoria princeps RMCB-10]